MKKSFRRLVIGLLIVGGLSLLALYKYVSTDATLPAISESDLTRQMMDRHGPPPMAQPPPVVLDMKRTIRLAISSLGIAEDSANRGAADLVLAELAGAAGLEMVERQSLDLALREMQLSLSGLVRARDAIRIGKLVRADWFVLGSPFKLGGTNAIVVRVVDAHTGILREAAAFAIDRDVARLARDLTAFIQQCRRNAAEGKSQTYLAIGSFEDLSLNSRQAAFPVQLRSYLTMAYQGANVTLLEREAANTLLQEVRLDLAGLTEEAGTNVSPMLAAYWMVDGFYQSYETSEFEVELALNVRRMFGRRQQIALREKPGEALLKRVKESIDGVMARDQAALTPTRLTELRAQLAAGEELARSVREYAWELSDNEMARRRRNTEEAIRAFETVLLLDPHHRDAKMGLASCFQLPFLDRTQEARDIYREILEAPEEDHWTKTAQKALLDSFRWESPDERHRWFEVAVQRTASIAAGEFYSNQLSNLVQEAILDTPGTPEAERQAEQLLFRDVANWEREIVQEHAFAVDFYNTGLGKFVDALGTNQSHAAQRLVELLPKLQAVSSNLAPHLLAGVVTFQVDTNAPIISEFVRTSDAFLRDTQGLFQPWYYFKLLSGPVYRWAEKKQLYSLAARMKELGIREASRERPGFVDAADNMKLAFCYFRMEAWQKALDIFQSFSNRPVAMGSDGFWGRAFVPVLTGDWANQCRLKLGLVPLHDPRHFRLQTNCVCLHTPSAFVTDDTGMWIGTGHRLMRLDFELHTNAVIELPVGLSASITSMAVGLSNVWVGTDGTGLVEFDKSNRKCRSIRERDGLLMDSIAALHPTPGALWIGYKSGVGQLDLQSGQVRSFMPPLALGTDKGTSDPLNAPPRETVRGIGTGLPGELWTWAANKGVQRYLSTKDSWETHPKENGSEVSAFAVDEERVVQGLSVSLSEIVVEAKIGAPSNAVPRTTLQVTSDELRSWQSTPNPNQRVVRIDTGGSKRRGEFRSLSFRDSRWESVLGRNALPAPPTALHLNGQDLWVGGEGYLGLVDIPRRELRKICYIPARTVDRIQVGGGYVWAQFDKHLHRAPLSDLQ